MRIFVDSADRQLLREALGYGYVYGVTTNPTLLRRANLRVSELAALVQHVLDDGAREVHLQVYGSDQQQMVREAETLLAIAPDQVVIKIPATAAGYAAAAQLTARGIRVTLTAIYTLRQALLAQSIGATYIAVYLGRMRDDGLDPFAIIAQMQSLIMAQASPVKILAASIREPAEVEILGALGVGAVTIAPPVLAQLLLSPATERAATTFGEDAHAIQ
jgi:transaldolase